MGFKAYKVHRTISNKKAAEEIVDELNRNSQGQWHLDEIDTETKEVVKLR